MGRDSQAIVSATAVHAVAPGWGMNPSRLGPSATTALATAPSAKVAVLAISQRINLRLHKPFVLGCPVKIFASPSRLMITIFEDDCVDFGIYAASGANDGFGGPLLSRPPPAPCFENPAA
jgi:hypothetical protein